METLQVRKSGKCINLHLNRPDTLNTLNNDMINSIRHNMKTAEILVFSGEGRSFCAGGDVIGLAKEKNRPSKFIANLYRLIYEISQLNKEKVAILDGITMGGGVGLGMALGTQVLTDKTLWAMPETAIGGFPDAGASWFLNKLATPELGLYLSLTGSRLKGPECYFAGISNIYIEKFTDFHLANIMNRGIQGAQELSLVPDSQKSKLLKELPLINQCFDCNSSVEDILQKLSTIGNEWSQRTINSLGEMCPKSLKIAKELMKVGKNLNLFEALELEINFCVKVCDTDNYNFVNSVLHKLVNKNKSRFEWRPKRLEEVSEQSILEMFEDLSYKLYGPNL